MKKLTALFVVLCALTNVAHATGINKKGKKPSVDSSFIYVYRGGQFGGALTNFSIWVDNEKICKLSNGKYMRVPVGPGSHTIEAKQGGVSVMKKETNIDVDVVKGKSNYVSCNMKQSITRVRLEMTEVVEKNGKKDIEKMSLDNCQSKIDD